MARKPNPESKQQRTPPPLPEDEWNFERVSEEDLPACYLWEFWREKCHRDPVVAAALKSVRLKVQSQDEEIRQHDQEQLSLYRLILEKSPDLPEAYAESLKVYGTFNLYEWSNINPLSTEMDGLANISEEYFPKRAFQSLEPLLKEIIRGKTTPGNRKGQLPALEEILNIPTGGHDQEHQEVEAVSFQVNWNYTDELIREAFYEWIRLRRAGRKATITRGLGPGKSTTKTLLKSLKDLGTVRLLNHYGSTPAASKALEEINRTMFVDKAEWSKAKSNVESILWRFNIISD